MSTPSGDGNPFYRLQWGRGLGAAEWGEKPWRGVVRHDGLQWGRGLGAAEWRRRSASVNSYFTPLQWGRGLGAAECRPAGSPSPRGSTFNGAAA